MNRTSRAALPFFTLLVLLTAGGMLYQFPASHGVILLTLSLSTIALIIFGEHFAFEDWLESRHIPGRDAILPLAALTIALAMGAVSPETLPRVFFQKIDIICLILSFAIMAEGIARSGYFAFAAYKVVANCHGSTTRLIIYLYLLTCLLAFFTSNDIVILVLTPVIISICAHARIHNARLILLSQFVAANTMSMGTLIGSPTNIIFGNALQMNFLNYFFMMLLPTLLCGALSLIVVEWINRQSRAGGNGLFARRWHYEDTYRIPASAHYAFFTSAMKTWLLLFFFAVILLAVISALHVSLLYAAIPTATSALLGLYYTTQKEGGRKAARADIGHVLLSLPYSILFFSMTFFIFADEMVRSNLMQNLVIPFIRENMLNDVVRASFGMLVLSGGLVNLINDLPAAALLSELVQNINHMQAGPMNEYLQVIVMQAILVGLNVGCYVTPIGALAGIMWFNIIRREERRQRQRENQHGNGNGQARKMLTPSRGDLVRYGLIHFAFICFFMGYLLPFFINLMDLLVSSPSHANQTALPGLVSIRQYLPYIGFGMMAFIIFSVRSLLKRSGVLLGHMREVFVVMTRLTVWTMKNRLLYLIILGASLLALASFLLYWSETTHEHIFGVAEGSHPLFDSLSSFFIWAMVFSGAGLSEAYQPHSALGMALTSILPVLVIGGIVLISQLSSKNTIKQLAQRMASGDIPGYRIVVVNFHSRFEKLVETMLHNRAATILLLCNPQAYDRAAAFCARLDAMPSTAFRVYAAAKHADASHTIDEYRVDKADEIFLLSDMTVLGEYDKIRYATRLDTTINTIRSAMAEGFDAMGSGSDLPSLEQGFRHMEGVPKIFVESCAERFHGLMKKASSALFLHSSVQTSFDRDIAALLVSDMDESMYSLNHYYSLGASARNSELFAQGDNPLRHVALRDFELDEAGKKVFRKHFSGPAVDEEDRALLSNTSPQIESKSVRTLAGAHTHNAHYLDNGTLHMVRNTDLLGVIADIAGSKVHLSIPSAALSMQPVNVQRVILKHAASGMEEPGPLFPSTHYRIFIFNLSQLARSFVRKLLPLFGASQQPRIIILCSQAQFIPEDIRNHPAVHIIQSDHMEALVQEICPAMEERSTPRADTPFRPLLQKGDRLYGFLEYDAPNAEAATIDFMDLLDTRLRKLVQDAAQHNLNAPISHPEIYIAMEAMGADSRFMMKNFYIDKIIDTSVPRVNYLETLSLLFHRLAADKMANGDMANTAFNFQRAAEIASYLCHFIVMLAEDVRLKDDMGTEISLLGKTMEEAVSDIRTYSSPPVQLFDRVRVELVHHRADGGRQGSLTFALVGVPSGQPIQAGDLLLNIPVI